LGVKLGIFLPIYGGWLRGIEEVEEVPTYSYLKRVASRAEEIGVDSIWVPDHLLNPIKGERCRCPDAWTILSAIAADTNRVELFHACLNQAFRYPSVLAKMGATLDDVSNGRFRLVLGAGWFEKEFRAYGLTWEDHDTRIARSKEQVQIVKAFWTQRNVNYRGKFYEVSDGVLEPPPVQKPRPPVWWAGDSEPSRELVADEVDGWLMMASTVESLKEKIADMNRRLEKRGRSKIMYAVPGRTFIDETDEKAQNKLRNLAKNNVEVFENVCSTGFVGSAASIAERIAKLAEIGFDYVIFQITPALQTLDCMEKQLMPLL